MSPAARSRVDAAPAGMMSIGEVIARLRGDFPDVTISKIRFLETEGLVEPSRTASGYRKFTVADLERLRYVLTAQRDQYLPLKVIRDHLEALDRGLEVPESGGAPRAPRNLVSAGSWPDAASFGRASTDIKLSRKELVKESGISDDLLAKLLDFGLVEPSHGGYFDADALVVSRTVAEMASYGFEPRHLRAFKTASEREAGLIEQVVAPMVRQRDPESRERATEAVREMAALSVRLHAALVRHAIPEELRG